MKEEAMNLKVCKGGYTVGFGGKKASGDVVIIL